MDESQIRLTLQTKLEETFPGVPVYYQPPGNKVLSRPCIVYEPKSTQPSHANNTAFTIGIRYQVTILSNVPGFFDKTKMHEISGITIISTNFYTVEDIVHDVFIVTVNAIA